MSQTIRAHRLSRKAFELGGQEMQEKFLDRLSLAYCGDDTNIGEFEVHGKLAEEVGVMPREQVNTNRIILRRNDVLMPYADCRIPR